jgi:hypothetical protein
LPSVLRCSVAATGNLQREKSRYSMKSILNHKGISGYNGLVLAVIMTATNDAINADRETMRDAWAYLGGDWYRLHADALGIPSDAWPVALEHSSTKRFIEITDKIMGAVHDRIA